MSVETETGSSGLTAAEQAYFDSRGTKTDGLGIEPDAGAAAMVEQPKPDPAPKPAADAAKPDAATAKPGADTDPDIEPTGDDGRPKNPGQYVRHQALHQERERRKTLEQRLAAEIEARTKEQVERAKVAERLDLLNQALTAPPAAAEAKPAEPPDPEKDIFGYAKWQGEQIAALSKRLDETSKQGQERHQQTAAQIAETNLRNAYVGDANRFAAANPDFTDHYQHLLQTRDKQLAHLGYTDPAKRAAMIAAEERGIVEDALKAGISPAERIYGLAKLMGYAPAAKADAASGAAAAAGGGNGAAPGNGSAGAGGGNGAAANGGAASSPAPSVTDEIARIKAGADASKSLSSAGGSPGGLTIEALANMGEEEFSAWMAKASKAQIRAVMGG